MYVYITHNLDNNNDHSVSSNNTKQKFTKWTIISLRLKSVITLNLEQRSQLS